jgi:hypothetical protein
VRPSGIAGRDLIKSVALRPFVGDLRLVPEPLLRHLQTNFWLLWGRHRVNAREGQIVGHFDVRKDVFVPVEVQIKLVLLKQR